MAVTRIAHTSWTGGLSDGSGTVFFDSSGIGAYEVTWPARSEQPGGKTSPEELIAAALSSCYSMALSHELTKQGAPPRHIDTQARVTLEPGAGITAVHLSVRAGLAMPGTTSRTPNVSPTSRTPNVADPAQQSRTPNVSPTSRTPNVADPAEQSRTPNLGDTDDIDIEFQRLAARVKDNCPVGQALSGVKITLDAALED